MSALLIPVAIMPPAVLELWTPEGLWIVLTAATTNAACAVVGCFLVLRRMSLMGDALSHAVLPGIAAAFIIVGSSGGGMSPYNIAPLFIGAVAAGLVTTFLTQTLHQYAGVPSDASMGVVFTSLFALGVILVKKGIHGGHFDVQCVFEGALEFTPFHTWDVFGRPLPQSLVLTAAVLTVNVLVIGLLWKEFKLSSFDPALATTMGFPAGAMHYLLMILVSLTAVASFEAVGSILVVAMLIVPAATAHLFADRLAWMVLLSVTFGVCAAIFGYVLGSWFDVSLAGMMTVAASGMYGIAVLASPRYGLLSTMLRNARLSQRVLKDDLLAMLYRVEELNAGRRLATADARAAVGGGVSARLALGGLLRRRQVVRSGRELELTPAGRAEARRLVRSHRLWEAYLVKHLGFPLDHVHEPADRVEHFIGPEMRSELHHQVEAADTDPHGREIPRVP